MSSAARAWARRASPPERPGTSSAARQFLETLGGLTWLTGGYSGVAVTEETALTISAMYRATVLVSSTIASFPRRLFDQVMGSPDVEVRDPRDAFLWGRPNPEVSGFEFWETVIGHEFLSGNAFLYVVRDGLLQPVELWPILPQRVRIYREKSGLRRKFYTIDGDDSMPLADATIGGEICHVAGFGRDGMRGLSLVQLMAGALSIGRLAEDYAGKMFGEGVTAAGVLETEQSLGDPEAGVAEKLAARWERFANGPRNMHRAVVMDSGLKWRPLQLNAAETQMIEARKFQVLDVARFTGLPAYMLDPEKTSSWGTGVSEQNQGFVTYTLGSHKKRFEETVTDELVMTSNRKFEFDASALLRGKLSDQVAAAGTLVRSGFDPAESVHAVGLPPIKHSGRLPVTVQAPKDPDEDQTEFEG